MNEVKKPAHYTWCKIEPKEVIYDWRLPWHLGNAIKYICRAGKKNKAEYILDLKKAQECLSDFIKREEEKDFHEGHEPQGLYDHSNDHFKPAKYGQYDPDMQYVKNDLVRGV